MKYLVNSTPSSSRMPMGQQRGFTLFEIVIVLALAVLISGLGIYHIAGPETERDLRAEHAKVEDLVLQARTLAVSYQQSFIVRFKDGLVEMEPQAKPENFEAEDDFVEGQRPGLVSLESQRWPRVENFSPGYLIEVSRWGGRGFNAITERHEEVWIFDPDGLCEPLEVRISNNERENTITRFYNPLTGLAKDDEVSISTQ